MTRTRALIAGLVAVVVLLVGGWLLYATVLNDPAAELTTADLEQRLDTPTSTATSTETSTATSDAPDTASPNPSGPLDGTWRVGEGSEVGYRVAEMLGSIATEGVGRTRQVEGGITIVGTVVTEASFTVDVASITSDSSRRDGQFAGRIMETSLFPTADFVLTEPIDLGAVPADGETVTVTATGDLTLHGVTRTVTFELTARIDNGRIGVLGSIPVVFADHDIANPSFGPIQTEDEGELEVLLVLDAA